MWKIYKKKSATYTDLQNRFYFPIILFHFSVLPSLISSSPFFPLFLHVSHDTIPYFSLLNLPYALFSLILRYKALCNASHNFYSILI